MKRHLPLAAVLLVQAVLTFSNLGLLPVWMDELFTLRTVEQSPGRILAILQADIHPPLYYLLLHAWPWHSLAGLRAFSGLWALAATLLLDLLWTRRWKPSRRWPAVCLFALSPALLLFGRMARSYSMQCALTVAAVYFLWRWIRTRQGALPAFALAVALLYTHYVPGLAVLAAFAVAALAPLGPARVALFLAGAGVAYAPWLVTLAGALRRWGEGGSFSAQYALTGSPWREQILKAGFGLTSLTVGETFPAFALLLIAPAGLLLWLGWRRAARLSRPLGVMLALAAVIGYAGSVKWVSYAFVGPRLLWLLPFVCLGIALALRPGARWRRAAVALLLLSSACSAVNYFRLSGYLNKGYAAPLREIAATIAADAGPAPLVLIDDYNTDIDGQRYYLAPALPAIVLTPGNEAAAREALARAATVWLVRNQRDISPGGLTSSVERAACAGRQRHVRLYLPYEGWEKLALRLLFRDPPTHFYQLTECKKPEAGQ